MSVFSRVAVWTGTGLAVLLALAGAVVPAAAQDAAALANRQFVRVIELLDEADRTYSTADESSLLREADRLLAEIIERYPESPLAVQLVTGQVIGEFDIYQFRRRIRSLACDQPLSTACFLFRIEALLPPIEQPVARPRWDWLSLAVAYHYTGDALRAREIIAPFVAAQRRAFTPTGATDDLYVARALALTGHSDLALDITRRVARCTTRIYNLTDIAEIAQWQGRPELAVALVDEATAYAARNGCAWELGLVIQAQLRVGREAEARTLFLNTVEQQFSRFRETPEDCCPAELAIAAADLGEINLALGLLRTVQDESPWAIPAVLGRLALKGETSLTSAYAEQVEDVELRAEILAELVTAAVRRGDRAGAEQVMDRLTRLVEETTPRRAVMLAQFAKAEKLLFDDDRWRTSFLDSIATAEQSSAFIRRDIGVPLLAALMRIETGLPLLE